MSILDIKARFSQRILDAEKEEEQKVTHNDVRPSEPPPVGLNVLEVDVGITKYVSDLPGFNAVIKQRYSDFNVHEIDPDGEIVVLNSYELPDETPPEIVQPIFISNETINNLEDLVRGSNTEIAVSIDVSGKTKDDRKSVHNFIKCKYGSSVISDTCNDADKCIINIRKSSKEVFDNRRSDHIPKFLHFTLAKVNMDTTDALNILGTKLRLKAKCFNISGTKDKRANTSQRVSVKLLLAAKLENLNKTLRKMKVGNFAYKNYSLQLGALKGNHFEIALRGVSEADAKIEESFNKLKERGFINYFGLQRFGKCGAIPTNEIGLQLIKEDYRKAIELILKPRDMVESPDLKQAREIYARTKNAAQALGALHHKERTIEGKILFGLKTHGNTAYINALDVLPRNVRLIYLHSYQSLVWNKIVSKRVEKYGLELLEGDLVFANEVSSDVVIDDNDKLEEIDGTDSEDGKERNEPTVKILTADDLSSYEIYDIVLPLPGTASVYPKNEIAQWYRDVLGEDGLTIDSFSARARQFSLGGSYRKIIQRPKNLSWKIVRHSNPDDDLILNDIDLMEGVTLQQNGEGPYKAVIVSFDLSPSTYATMALREVLRADTSASSQTQLNNSLKRPGDVEQNGLSKKRKEDNEETANDPSQVLD